MKLLRVLEERQIERLGSPTVDPRRHADHRRDPPQPGAAGRRGTLPGRPVLPAQRVPDSRAAAAGARRGHPAAGLALHRGVLDARSASGSRGPAETWRRCSAYVAGKHPRAAQRRRARDDSRHRASADHPDPHAADCRPRAQLRLSMCRGTTSASSRGASWRVRGTGGAADRLGLRPTTLETRMAKLGLAGQTVLNPTLQPNRILFHVAIRGLKRAGSRTSVRRSARMPRL